MTFREWQTFAQEIDARAYNVSQMILDRARDIGEQVGAGRDFCFLAARNWYNIREYAKYRASFRKILYLEEKSYEPHRLADRITGRAWNRMAAEHGYMQTEIE